VGPTLLLDQGAHMPLVLDALIAVEAPRVVREDLGRCLAPGARALLVGDLGALRAARR
jgi:hypothetical protein